MEATLSGCRGRSSVAVAGAFLLALAVLGSSVAAGATDLVVRITGRTVASRKGVTVAVTGGSLAAPLTGTTNSLGKAKFTALEAGSYVVVPVKVGWRYVPESALVVLDGLADSRVVKFAPKKLPALSSLSADPNALSLLEAGTATVTVTVLNSNGLGVEGAPVEAASSDPLLAGIEPAVIRTNAEGKATFTVTAAGTGDYSAIRPLRERVGTATMTFTSGGWRGTAVKAAETIVTVETDQPAVSTLSIDQGAVTLLEGDAGLLMVTVADAGGQGIAGAPVAASSTDPTIARVVPATATTDAAGHAFFTATAVATVESVGPSAVGTLLGAATMTFTSGGWRGTAVKTAQAVVTVRTDQPAASTLTVDQTALVLPEGESRVVTLTVLDGAGLGIAGAAITAASADVAVARVEPAAAVADADGKAAFTIIAAGSMLTGELVANTTVDFTSGGWRGTPVRTAATIVSLKSGQAGTLWASSPHASSSSRAFHYWDAAGAIAVDCAACHSRMGFLEFINTGSVAVPLLVGTVVDCFVCHDAVAMAMDTVGFPSGQVVGGLGAEAICMTCHQGMAAGTSVDAAVLGLPVDDVDPTLGFVDVHLGGAAATQYGTQAKGGYEYTGKTYQAKATHDAASDSCVECHESHSLAVMIRECRVCHAGVNDLVTARQVRVPGGSPDYDGDGNSSEPLLAELDTLAAVLYARIRTYASTHGGDIVYAGLADTYFFRDFDHNGVPDVDGGGAAIAYDGWTPRLLKAAFNYRLYRNDPGAWMHNGGYTAQLLIDSILDLDPTFTSYVRP